MDYRIRSVLRDLESLPDETLADIQRTIRDIQHKRSPVLWDSDEYSCAYWRDTNTSLCGEFTIREDKRFFPLRPAPIESATICAGCADILREKGRNLPEGFHVAE